MTDVAERARHAAGRDPRETLEPLLEDLARALRFDRGLVLLHDEPSASLRGAFGLNVSEEHARLIAVALSANENPLIGVLRTGAPLYIEDAATDKRFDPPLRAGLEAMGMTRFVAAPVADLGVSADRPERSRRTAATGVVLFTRAGPISDADLEGLTAFAHRASAALTRELDVDLLRRASDAHAAEKEWLWWMVNAVADPVVVTDTNNDILYDNRRAQLLFRSSDDYSAGRRRAVWMNNFLFTAALSTWNLDRSSRVTNREVTLVDPIEGDELIFEVITAQASNYRTSERGTVSVLKDVTDIRHMTEELTRTTQRVHSADEEIRAERDRLDLVLRSVPNPIMVVDNENQIITTNAAAQRLFAAREGRRGQLALANDARFTSFLAALRLDPAATTRHELALTDPETEERLEVEVTATDVRDANGAVVAIVSVMQDVGRLRELERRRLQQVLFESEKLAATGRLAASIAHEINNPLEAVQNALYLLVRALPDDHADREYLDIARRETQRMSRILRQMLGFYRPASDMAPTDVNAVIEEAGALVAKPLREADVRLTKELDPQLPVITASGDQLKQVFLNLFLNAVEAMTNGGTLHVWTRAGAGELEGVVGSAIQIGVRDTGPGMDDATVARIFEPFFSTKSQRGTGLGLWVSHGIVQSHGGTMTLRSQPGRGTTFTITLPIAGVRETHDNG